jgi:hypothetical protein
MSCIPTLKQAEAFIFAHLFMQSWDSSVRKVADYRWDDQRLIPSRGRNLHFATMLKFL